jgi:hypothetical protein
MTTADICCISVIYPPSILLVAFLNCLNRRLPSPLVLKAQNESTIGIQGFDLPGGRRVETEGAEKTS